MDILDAFFIFLFLFSLFSFLWLRVKREESLDVGNKEKKRREKNLRRASEEKNHKSKT
jgi:hypothetical protein